MQKSKIEIIEETVEFYNIYSRARTDIGCRYLTEDGRSCAVGRCCIAPQLDWEGLVYDFNDTGENIDDNLLKEEYRGHSIDFWSSLQTLHDTNLFWDEKGLTVKGKAFVDNLRGKYS